ncbi:MAG: DUF3592 domain-containing protein [Streptosporangiales bacterium]|nr:DUF3592 domain-containing protein [Streptosporangiales bacterium]
MDHSARQGGAAVNGGQITGLVLTLVGVVAAVVMFLVWRQQRAFWQRARPAEATVVGHQQRRHRETSRSSGDSGSRTTYRYYHALHPAFAFRTAEGLDVQTVSGTGARGYPRYHSGQRVRVSYDPQSPDDVSTGKGGEVPVFRTVMLAGVALAVVGLVVVVLTSV